MLRLEGLPYLVGLVLITVGCAGPSPSRPTATLDQLMPPSVELSEVPFYAQEAYQCGPAALAMVLRGSGVEVTPADLTPAIYLPERRGSLQLELVAASRRYGRLPYTVDPTLPALIGELHAGRPVLVLHNLGWKRFPWWHYAVVVGFDRDGDRLILRSGTSKREVVSTRRFLDQWREAESWGMVVLRPGELPTSPRRDDYLKAAAGLEAAGQTAAALASYHAALDIWPGDPVATLGVGNAHYAMGELRQAEAAYRRLLASDPQQVVAHNNLAQVLIDQGCQQAALREIDFALALAESDSGLHHALSDTRREILASGKDGAGDKRYCQSP